MKRVFSHSHLQFQADQEAKDIFCRKRRSLVEWAARLDRLSFTLVELLVVIAIIGILLMILIPSLVQIRLFARRTVCLANLGIVGKAALIYQTVYNGYVPICWANISTTYPCPWKSWRTNLLAYAPGFATFNCPAASDNGQIGETFHSDAEITGNDMDNTINAGSYGVLYQYSLPSYKTLNYMGVIERGHPMWSCAFPTVPDAAWRDPPNSVYAADSCLTKGPVTYPSQNYKSFGTSAIVPPSETSYFNIDITRRFADRHLGTNCLFLDGKVLSYETKDLDSMSARKGNCVWDTE